MSLLLTESCDIGLLRWNVNGSVSSIDNGGVGKSGSFAIESSYKEFQNNIAQQFRDIDRYDNSRSVRISFWFKSENMLIDDSNFLKIESAREKCGAVLGINKNGQLYSGYLTKDSIWQGKFAEENISQPNILDNHYHYIEIEGLWQDDNTSYVRIYVDNVLYINFAGNNSKDGICWSRPDRITFGNLNGANLQIDDIIVWDDLGLSYNGYKGSTRLKTTKAISVEEYIKKSASKTYNINSATSPVGAMLTMLANSEEGKSSSVSIYTKVGSKEQISKEYSFVSTAPQTIKIPVDTSGEDASKFTVGFKRTK